MAGVIMLGSDGRSFAIDGRDRVEGPECNEAREGREECCGDCGGDATDVVPTDCCFGDMTTLNWNFVRHMH